MFDRYENKSYELEIELRTGAKFIKLAQALYDLLASSARYGGQKEKLQALRSAIIELDKIWLESQNERLPFAVPEKLQNDYVQAKRYYSYLKANPSEFYQKESSKYDELLQEQQLLEDKIAKKELEVSRAEDDIRHYVRDNRARINIELADLKIKKIKYEALKDKRQQSCLSACFKGNKHIVKLPATLANIARLEEEVKKISNYVNSDLEDKRDYLKLLRDKRWDIGNQLSLPQESHQVRMGRWNDAISRSEVTMIFRRLDIEKAVKRYYANEDKQIIHGMLNVYSFINELAAQVTNKSEKLTDSLSAFNSLAEHAHCADVGNLSVLALHRVISELKEEQKNQIIHLKPKKDFLPELLMRALSSTFIAKSLDSVGLYRKALASAEADNSAKAGALQAASFKK